MAVHFASHASTSGREIVKGGLFGTLALLPLLAGAYYAFGSGDDDLCFEPSEVEDADLDSVEKAEIRRWSKATLTPAIGCLKDSLLPASGTEAAGAALPSQCQRARIEMATHRLPLPADEVLRERLVAIRSICLRSLDDQMRRLTRPRYEGDRLHGGAQLRVCTRLINDVSRKAGRDLLVPACETADLDEDAEKMAGLIDPLQRVIGS